METKIKKFWEYLEKESFSILEDLQNGIPLKDKFQLLTYLLKNIHPKLEVIINRPPTGDVHFIFLTKGVLRLKIIISEILKMAPINTPWQFTIGLQPWSGSFWECCKHYKFLGTEVTIYGCYFDVFKIYSSTGKLHLQIHVEKNKPLPKHFLNERIKVMLLFYLGDTLFHKKIAYIKIVQRKYRNINFIPIHELKSLLEFARI